MSVASDYAGLYQWLVADSGTYNDQSGNGHHGVLQGNSHDPTIWPNAANGHDTFQFVVADQQYVGLGNLSAFTAGEMFIVIKTKFDPPADNAHSGCWIFSNANNGSWLPWTDRNIYDNFGSTARPTVGNPTQQLDDDVHVINIWSGPGDWGYSLDDTLLFHTTSNTVAFAAACYLGQSAGGRYLDGWVAEYALYSQLRSSAERSDLIASLRSTYQGAFVGPPTTARVSAVGVSVPIMTVQPIPTAIVGSLGISAPIMVTQPIPAAIVGSFGASVVLLPSAVVPAKSRFYIID